MSTANRGSHAVPALAACAVLALSGCGPGMQARAVASGTAAPIGSLEDWGFNSRSMQPGYLYGQSSAGSHGRRSDRLEPPPEPAVPRSVAIAAL